MENRDNKYMLEVKNVRTIDIPEVTNRGLISRKNVYSKLPTVLAGEYAEVLSSNNKTGIWTIKWRWKEIIYQKKCKR